MQTASTRHKLNKTISYVSITLFFFSWLFKFVHKHQNYTTMDDGMINELKVERKWSQFNQGTILAFAWRETKKNHKNISQDSWCPSRDLN
jgi:hypothetical protein